MTSPMHSPLQSPLQPVMRSPLEFRRRGGFNIASTNPSAYYDRTNLATLFRYFSEDGPVTATGQTIGLGMDQSYGAELDDPLTAESTAVVMGTASWEGNTVTLGPGFAGSNMLFSLADLTNAGMYEIIIDVKSFSGTTYLSWCNTTSLIVTATGIQHLYAFGGASYTEGSRHIQVTSLANAVIEIISVRLVKGHHQQQATIAKRPMLSGFPFYADFDADYELITTFPSSLGAGCTVCRSLPGTGASITTGVTLTATYTDNVDAHFLAIYTAAQWAALDAGQIANITKLLNQKAGL